MFWLLFLVLGTNANLDGERLLDSILSISFLLTTCDVYLGLTTTFLLIDWTRTDPGLYNPNKLLEM